MTENNSLSYNIIIDEYNEFMCNYNKAISNIKKSKNQIKIESENMTIPTIYTYNEMEKYNYNLPQLKTIAKNYNSKNCPRIFTQKINKNVWSGI
jgi:hypothetical protein